MIRLRRDRQEQITAALAEGNSPRATGRMRAAAANTVLNSPPVTRMACEEYHDRAPRNLPPKRIQCDETRPPCYAKQKNVPTDKQGQFGYGDVWTRTAACTDTKQAPSRQADTRGAGTAYGSMNDLAAQLAHRAQPTTDGHRVYPAAAESAIRADIDYATLAKMYRADREGSEGRHSPARHTGRRMEAGITNHVRPIEETPAPTRNPTKSQYRDGVKFECSRKERRKRESIPLEFD